MRRRGFFGWRLSQVRSAQPVNVRSNTHLASREKTSAGHGHASSEAPAFSVLWIDGEARRNSDRCPVVFPVFLLPRSDPDGQQTTLWWQRACGVEREGARWIVGFAEVDPRGAVRIGALDVQESPGPVGFLVISAIVEDHKQLFIPLIGEGFRAKVFPSRRKTRAPGHLISAVVPNAVATRMILGGS